MFNFNRYQEDTKHMLEDQRKKNNRKAWDLNPQFVMP